MYMTSRVQSNSGTVQFQRIQSCDRGNSFFVITAECLLPFCFFKWKAVKGASGYTVFRKEKGGKWKNVAEVKGAKKTAFSDTKVITGTQYNHWHLLPLSI